MGQAVDFTLVVFVPAHIRASTALYPEATLRKPLAWTGRAPEVQRGAPPWVSPASTMGRRSGPA